MKTKPPLSFFTLHDELDKLYGEWFEMGYPKEFCYLSLLYKEIEKNEMLKDRINYLEKKIRL